MMFLVLDLETCSYCNRRCPTCIRNSHPDREKIQPWMDKNFMPMDMVQNAFEQAVGMGFSGDVCLSHYNEPLFDKRLPEIARLAKAHNFKSVFINSNSDYLTDELAEKLDGVLDRIIFSLYDGTKEDKLVREARIRELFHNTTLEFNDGEHMVTHFSPLPELNSLIDKHKNKPCVAEPIVHCIINHRGQYLLCCEDVIGNYNLGKFPELGIEEYWFGEKHMRIIDDLKLPEGRLKYPYCSICPRN